MFNGYRLKEGMTTIALSELKQYFGGSSDEASQSVCVYSETSKDLAKIFAKHDRIEEIKGGSLVTFSTPALARKAVSNHHGKKGKIVCLGFTLPSIALGHNPNIFVIRNLIEEITIPQLWAFLDADKNLVSHISILPTPNRDVVILCKDREGQKRLLSKNRSKLGGWALQIDLWCEFCARLNGKELFVENLPEGTTVDSLKTLLGLGNDDLEFVEIDEVHRVSLIVCKSRLLRSRITNCDWKGLKFSLVPKLSNDNQIFLNNLHETSTESDVWNFMSSCGNVMKVICWLDNKTGCKKAKVIFEVPESSENALKLGGTELKGLPVSVFRWGEPDPPKTLKASEASEAPQAPQAPQAPKAPKAPQAPKVVSVIATIRRKKFKPIDLCLMFQDCGYIEDVTIPPTSMKKFLRSKPALITFRDDEAVKKALSKNSERGLRLSVALHKAHATREDELEPSPAKKRKIYSDDD